MYPLFESIKVVDGEFVNLEWHQQRVDKSRTKVLGSKGRLDLETGLMVPKQYGRGLVKCRVSYGEVLGSVVFSKYLKKEIKTLQQVECEPFDYSVKYENRSRLEQVYQLRGSSDEVLITFNGIISDTSYSNIVFHDGSRWYTPEKPLLEGTQRAKLLALGAIKETVIHIADLINLKKLVLINAMLEFQPNDFIEVKEIKLWQGEQFTTR